MKLGKAEPTHCWRLSCTAWCYTLRSHDTLRRLASGFAWPPHDTLHDANTCPNLTFLCLSSATLPSPCLHTKGYQGSMCSSDLLPCQKLRLRLHMSSSLMRNLLWTLHAACDVIERDLHYDVISTSEGLLQPWAIRDLLPGRRLVIHLDPQICVVVC